METIRTIGTTRTMEKTLNLIGRILLAHIFILSGVNKITGYSGTQQYMESMGVPGILLPLVILIEVGGGLALLLGWQTRIAAWVLAVFTVASAMLFHTNFADQMQMISFMKNMAITGGLLFVAAYGADELSLDYKLAKNRHKLGIPVGSH